MGRLERTSVKRLSPSRLLNISMILIFLLLVLPLYVNRGASDSLDHARDTGTVGGIDFKAYYIAADLLRRGQDFYDVELQTQEVLARRLPLNQSFYIYPPLVAMAFVPLTALSMETAAQLWFFVNLTLYGLALAVITRALRLDRLASMLPLLLILAFLFPPALFTMYKGQVNILLLLLLALTYWLYRKGWKSMAGAALGLAVMIKIVPLLLLLYFLCKRQYVLSLAAIGTIFAIGALGLVIVGPGPHQTYCGEVIPVLAEPRPNPANQSLGGFLSLLLVENAYTDHVVHSPGLWKALTWVFSLAFVLAAGAITRPSRTEGLRMELEVALVIATMPLVANIAWVDMFVLLLFPYAVLLNYFLIWRDSELTGRLGAHPDRRPRLRRALLACMCASVVFVSSPRFLDLLAGLAGWQSWLTRNALFLSLPFFGLLILWMSLALILTSPKGIPSSCRSPVPAR